MGRRNSDASSAGSQQPSPEEAGGPGQAPNGMGAARNLNPAFDSAQ